MAQKFRSRKENGEVIRYPVRGRGNTVQGVPKKTANFYASQIREAYPDINPRVLQVGNKKDNLYSPFVPYLVDQVMRALPIGSGENLLRSLPSVTLKAISGIIGSESKQPVYYLFYGSNGGGTAIFGKDPSGTLEWMIDIPGVYPEGDRDRVIVKAGNNVEERLSSEAIDTARTTAMQYLKQLRDGEAKEDHVTLSDSEVERLYGSLLTLGKDAFVEFSIDNGVIGAFPINESGTSFTYQSSVDAYPEGKQGFYSADALKSALRGFLNSGMPVLSLSYIDKAENPLLIEFPISVRKQGGFQQALSSEDQSTTGSFSAVIAPFSEPSSAGAV